MRTGTAAGADWPMMAALVAAVLDGEFDRALERAADLEARVPGESQIHAVIGYNRAMIHAFRGETEDAFRELGPAVEQARRIGDAQTVPPVLSTMALASFVSGRIAEAHAALDELLATPEYMVPRVASDYTLLMVELGRQDVWLANLKGVAETLWLEAGRAAAQGELTRAAEIYDEIGAPLYAAWARLLAAERGDLAQLESARAVFAAARATPFLARCDAVLAASA